ncbi:hypothetical protein [Saezia sanguinis]|uniref:hypothetical protein n=1 Tax=Saezia sanguinis TaxID=1965230 RepID=UPI0030645F77
MEKEKLSRIQYWQAISTIFAAVAIPVIVAFFGYIIQRQLSNDNIRKDYVAMALDIIKGDAKSQSEEVRAWAVEMLNENSPIPFSGKAQDDLRSNTIYVRPQIPPPPDSCVRESKTDEMIAAYSRALTLMTIAKDSNDTQFAIDAFLEFSDKVMSTKDGLIGSDLAMNCLRDWAFSIHKTSIGENSKSDDSVN